MTLPLIVLFSAGALVYGAVVPARLRRWVVLVVSLLAVYALQPLLSIRYLDFILPTAIILLTLLVWAVTGQDAAHEDRITAAAAAAAILAVALTRYLSPELRFVPSRPPDAGVVAAAAAATLALIYVVRRWGQGYARALSGVLIALIVALFVVLKSPALATEASRLLRLQTGQDAALANPADLGWLGFSYVAFRLLHVLLDFRAGRLPALPLRSYVNYALFFPAYTAGPIDRIERFAKDERALPETDILTPPRIVEGTTRIVIGIFKKFVIADSLALAALNATNAQQTDSTLWLWALLYLFSFRLYFDFSGYTDIAIGIGCLYGIRLPENFDRPYLKPSLAAFWQSWHITLSTWARFYVFSPLSRFLLTRKPKPSPLLVVFSAQLATMIVIGLWHGMTPTFVVWGIWHGLGLFVHKWWSDRTRRWYIGLQNHPRLKQAWTAAGVLITFHFVTLGWVWFALPDMRTATATLLRLFGMGG